MKERGGKMNWVLIQQIVMTILAMMFLIIAVIALIRVVPEINEIVRKAALEDEKKDRDCNHGQN